MVGWAGWWLDWALWWMVELVDGWLSWLMVGWAGWWLDWAVRWLGWAGWWLVELVDCWIELVDGWLMVGWAGWAGTGEGRENGCPSEPFVPWFLIIGGSIIMCGLFCREILKRVRINDDIFNRLHFSQINFVYSIFYLFHKMDCYLYLIVYIFLLFNDGCKLPCTYFVYLLNYNLFNIFKKLKFYFY